MANNQNTSQDDSRFPSLLAASGTSGTAETRKITSANTAGALDVHIAGTSIAIGGGGTTVAHQGSASQYAGTANYWPVRIFHSTGEAINSSGGNVMVNVSNFAIGEFGTGNLAPNLTSALAYVNNYVFEPVSGTWNRAPGDGTLGAYVNVKVLPNIPGGTIGSILGIGGTVTVSSASAGTNVNIVTGTQQTLGTVGTIPGVGVLTTVTSVSNLVSGTLLSVGTLPGVGVVTSVTNLASGTLLSSGTTTGVGVVTALTTGSVAVTVGTIVGPTASGGTPTTAPILIAGTDATGTVYAPLVSAAGILSTSATTVLNTGTITTIVAGTQNTLGTVGVVNNLVTGTLANSGTTTGVGVVTSVTNLVSGTLLSAGTVTGVGVVTALSVGTVGGKAASGAAAVANPVQIAGTDAGGTIYSPLVTVAGALTTTGTVTGVGVVTSVTNLASGTLLSSGTTTGVGVVSALTTGSVTMTVGTVTTGSLSNVAMLNAGTVVQASGTTTLVTTLSNLTNGSVNILTGTLQSSGTTTGVGVVTSVTNLAAGTVQRSSVPVQVGTSFVTHGTTGAAVWGTIIAASGAGTKQYVSGLSLIAASGTVDVAITNIGVGGSVGAGVLTRGQVVPSAGIVREFDPVMVSGTNGTISYWLGGAGTVDITVNYWQGV